MYQSEFVHTNFLLTTWFLHVLHFGPFFLQLSVFIANYKKFVISLDLMQCKREKKFMIKTKKIGNALIHCEIQENTVFVQ